MRVARTSRSLISAATFHIALLAYPLSRARTRTLILASTMASEDLSTVANGHKEEEDDEKYGFRRPEMYKESLAGTVGAYDRHVFLCYKSPEAWPSRVEGSESDPLPKLLFSALKARKDEMALKTNLTICEGGEGTNFSDGEVLIFPEMVKYRGLKDSEVDSFVEDVLVNGKPWASGEPEVLTGSHVFVCSHGSRDRRCGVCGPVLIEKLKEEIESRGLKDRVFVSPCSHVGGHKYAGNVIIYSQGPDGNIMGHWYGYVTPDDVPALLDQHIGKGEIIEHLWRGQMGAATEEGGKGGKEDEQKVPNGDVEKNKTKPKENDTQDNNDNVAGCCQVGTGFTCCRDGGLEQSVSEDKKLKESIAVNENKGLDKLSNWMGSWEQSDVLTVAAVVGAVATVAVAYSFYRRSG